MPTFQYERFTLDIEPKCSPPTDEMFNQHSPNIGLHYGADFVLTYRLKTEMKYPIGILQFIKPSQLVGNPLGDRSKNLYIDKEQVPGKGKLKDYLYGDPNKNISHETSSLNGMPMCVRTMQESVIRDIPREIIGYDLDVPSQTMMLRKAPQMVFFDFMVEIQGEYCVIHPSGVTFTIGVVQQGNPNGGYLNQYDLSVSDWARIDFNKLKLDEILKLDDRIDSASYRINTKETA